MRMDRRDWIGGAAILSSVLFVLAFAEGMLSRHLVPPLSIPQFLGGWLLAGVAIEARSKRQRIPLLATFALSPLSFFFALPEAFSWVWLASSAAGTAVLIALAVVFVRMPLDARPLRPTVDTRSAVWSQRVALAALVGIVALMAIEYYSLGMSLPPASWPWLLFVAPLIPAALSRSPEFGKERLMLAMLTSLAGIQFCVRNPFGRTPYDGFDVEMLVSLIELGFGLMLVLAVAVTLLRGSIIAHEMRLHAAALQARIDALTVDASFTIGDETDQHHN